MTITLEEMRKLEAAATKGPWKLAREPIQAKNGFVACVDTLPGCFRSTGFYPYEWENACFIAESRNLLPLLLDLWQAIRDHGIIHDPRCDKSGVSTAPCTCEMHDLWKAAGNLE